MMAAERTFISPRQSLGNYGFRPTPRATPVPVEFGLGIAVKAKPLFMHHRLRLRRESQAPPEAWVGPPRTGQETDPPKSVPIQFSGGRLRTSLHAVRFAKAPRPQLRPMDNRPNSPTSGRKLAVCGKLSASTN